MSTGLVRLMRPNCPECHGGLDWFSGLGAGCGALGFDMVNQFLEWLDVSDDSGELDFWRCRKCGESGAFAS